MKKTILFIVLATLCPFFELSAQNNSHAPKLNIIGKVTDEHGQPLAGATIKLKGTDINVVTDETGTFKMASASKIGLLVISFVGYPTTEISFNISNRYPIIITLKSDRNILNEVQVIGYGTTTKMLNTGSVAAITAADIEKQPVTNVLSALSGRATGVFIQTTNGLPGGGISIQIRGTGSISAGTNPLYVIDGVPFNSTVGQLTALNNLSTSAINGEISPFNSLNPDDIESISILKDADATAIYGSRGSNGVVLITTKKGKAGKTKVNFNISHGLNEAANLPKLLDLQQYLQIRNEAFKNDGLIPSSDPNSANYAPDLTAWGNTQTKDWAKYLLGNTGQTTNAQATISGGNENTSFTAGGNFRSETTYLPGNNLYQRGGVYANIQHTSENRKFIFQMSSTLTIDNNQLVNPSANIAFDMLLPPNYPIFDVTGNFNWYAGANPVAEINATAKTKSDNILSNILLQYNIIKDLSIKVSAGYNKINIDQTQIFPSVSLYPGSINYTNFGSNYNQSFIIEPQINFVRHFKSSTLNLLGGGTYQSSIAQGNQTVASNFSSTSLMQNLGSAGNYQAYNTYTQYKYASVFGRATYNLNEKYIINASIRQDASSRFGSGNRIGTFGAVGAAWLWGDETFIKSTLPFISFGKLRASYGLTGNDQITDYQYLSTYTSSGYVYQDISGLKPSRIANADFHWETTKKLELAAELGFFKDRILLNANRYINRSSDQLVNYTIPTLTGFTSYQANLPAVVQNTGWEFELTTKNIQGSQFHWTTSFNITLPKNELISFQNLATSSYANSLVIGQDITRITGYQLVSLDNNGLPLYGTQSGVPSNTPNSATDAYSTLGKRTPDFYGGFGNSLSYKNWSIDIFGQFAKQIAVGGMLYSPGFQAFNNYAVILNRWTSATSQTNIPKASTNYDFYYTQSSGNIFDASYFRLKNVAVSYNLPRQWLLRLKIVNAKIYFQGQNLWTAWHKNTALLDPETGGTGLLAPNLPPAKTFVIGIQTTF